MANRFLEIIFSEDEYPFFETYDFIVTIPESGKPEIRATAQDDSGHASAYLGKGKVLPINSKAEEFLKELFPGQCLLLSPV